MKKLIKHKNGQFVIIAVLMIAIMIISIGALMHRAVTYYKHEPWEEYLTLIGAIELNSRRLVELSLANYTNTDSPDNNTLRINLEKWQTNLTAIYPGYGISLGYSDCFLAYDWNETSSSSSANATFSLNIASIGLTGYKFMAKVFLNLTILNKVDNEINVTVRGEEGIPISSLRNDNFQVSISNSTMILNITSVTSYYEPKEALIYTIKCSENITTPITVRVWDERGIQVRAEYS